MRRQKCETDPVRLLAVDPSGSLVFSATEHCIKVFRWATRELVTVLPYESGQYDRLVTAPGGFLLAIAPFGTHGWNLDTGVEKTLSLPIGDVHGCVSLSDGAVRLLTSSGRTTTIWDLATFEPLRQLYEVRGKVWMARRKVRAMIAELWQHPSSSGTAPSGRQISSPG